MNVLIVDDHEIVRDGLALLLQDFFEVKTFIFASDWREAMQKAEQADIQLVMLDLSIPDANDGFQVAIYLRKQLPKAFIVIFSMHEEIEYLKRAYEIGVDGYLIKRLKGETIIRDLTTILNGEKVFNGLPSNICDDETIKGISNQETQELPITLREKEIFVLTVSGYTQKEIAEQLTISLKTVENHRHNISNKIGTTKKSEWIQLAKQFHYI